MRWQNYVVRSTVKAIERMTVNVHTMQLWVIGSPRDANWRDQVCFWYGVVNGMRDSDAAQGDVPSISIRELPTPKPLNYHKPSTTTTWISFPETAKVVMIDCALSNAPRILSKFECDFFSYKLGGSQSFRTPFWGFLRDSSTATRDNSG